MSEVHKLEVVISASNAKLKQAMREAQEATRRTTSTVNAELKKMRPPSLQSAIQGVKNYMKQLQMAAGIKVHTDDYKELEKDIRSAENAVDKLKQKMAGLDESKRYVPTQEFKDLEKSIQSSEGKLAKLREKSTAMQNAGKSTEPTAEYKELDAQRLSALRRLAKMTDTSGTRRKSWSASDVEDTKKEIAYLSGELKKMRKAGESAVPTQAFQNLTNEIAKAERQLQEYRAQREQMIASGANQQESEAWRRTSAEIAQAEAQLQEYQAKKQQLEASGGDVKLSGAGVKGFGSKLFSGMESVFRGVTSGIKSAGGAFAALIQRFRTGIPHINNARNALNGIGKSGSGLGSNFRSLRRIVRALFLSFGLMSGARGMKTGLQNLAQYSSSANSSLSQLRAGLSALQNGLAVAFEPILTYIAPALNTLIDYLLTACNAIAQFMAALTGQSTYTIAKRGTSDFAAGATAAGNAAGGAQKKAEKLKRTLMSFDEINKLDDNDSSSGGGGGGAGGGTGFDTEEVTSQYADLVEKIKKAWADADFTEIGTMIGEKLKAGLDNIKWDEIQATAAKIGKSVATLINGFVETSGLDDSVGKTVAGLLNTGIAGSTAFLTNLHWDSIGSFIAGSMNSAIRDTDWSGAGVAVCTGINGVFTLADTWSGKFDFKAAGTAVKNAINSALSGINWKTAISAANNIGSGVASALNAVMTPETFKNVGKSIAGAVNTVISGAYASIGKINWKGWGNAIGSGINNFFADLDWEKAGLTFNGAVRGIITTMRSAIETADWDQIGRDIAKFIKAIDFPGLLKEIGKLLWAAINAAIESWKSSFKTAPIETTIVTGILALKFTGLGSSLGKKIWGIISGGIAGAEVIGSEAEGGLIAGIKSLFSAAATKAGEALGGLGGIANTIFQAAGGIGSPLGIFSDPEIVGYWKNGWIEFFENMEPYATGAAQNLLDKVKGIFKSSDETPEVEIPIGASDETKPGVDSAKKNIGSLPNETDPKLHPSITASDNTYAGVSAANNQLAKIPESISTAVTAVVNAFQDSIKKKDKSISSFVATVSSFSNGIAKKKRSISGFKATITSVTSKKTFSVNVKANITGVNPSNTRASLRADGGVYQSGRWRPITAAASGGAFSTGQMFLAREAGPELVGSIGRSTAVMNNNQIVASVSAGVYSAVCAAIGRMGSGKGSSPTINVYVGGKKITDVVVEEVNSRTMATGQCPILT